MEKSIYFSNVGMLEKSLNFNLSDELRQEILLYNSFLLDHLQGHHETCVLLHGKKDASERALA